MKYRNTFPYQKLKMNKKNTNMKAKHKEAIKQRADKKEKKERRSTMNRKINSNLIKKCRGYKITDSPIPKIIRTQKEGKGNGILSVPKMTDYNEKKYIPFCNLPWHPGIILDNAESCIERRCPHYRTLYLEKPTMSQLANHYFRNRLKLNP